MSEPLFDSTPGQLHLAPDIVHLKELGLLLISECYPVSIPLASKSPDAVFRTNALREVQATRGARVRSRLSTCVRSHGADGGDLEALVGPPVLRGHCGVQIPLPRLQLGDTRRADQHSGLRTRLSHHSSPLLL